ncbi:MAG TPA: amino acid racemase [Pyrinomonadaceae bacterium]|nr:amino acid racemase [Pyrinomonadaceae bacterium]
MAQHIGIVACSAEGAALCYRTICMEALAVMGEHNHPEVTMNSIPMARHMLHIAEDDWEGVAELMLESARKVAKAGATFAICPDNTVHQALPYLVNRSPIPWLHIAEEVAAEASQRGFRHLAVLGTKYLMEGPVYVEALAKYEIERQIPDAPDRERINTIIFKELVNGLFPEESRLYFNEVMEKMKARGCDAAVLGCTEIPLIVRPDDAPLPTLDSTRLLARAAIRKALDTDHATDVETSTKSA